MNKEKFTPGPWLIDETDSGYTYFKNIDEEVICSIMQGYNECEAANMDLIAAAPDMFEALKYAKEVIEIFIGKKKLDKDDLFKKSIDKANSALNKANPNK